jgi:hypothetical protein
MRAKLPLASNAQIHTMAASKPSRAWVRAVTFASALTIRELCQSERLRNFGIFLSAINFICEAQRVLDIGISLWLPEDPWMHAP